MILVITNKTMKKYKIIFTEVLYHEVEVKAKSASAARDIVLSGEIDYNKPFDARFEGFLSTELIKK